MGRPRDKKDLRVFSGRIAEVTCPCIAVLGTDWSFPVAMMTLSGGCLLLMGVWFFKEAWRDFTSEDFLNPLLATAATDK